MRPRILGMLLAFGIVISGLSGIMYDSFGADVVSAENGGASRLALWYDFAWGYRKPVAVDNSQNPSGMTNAPIMLNLSVGDLVSAGKMKSDRGDMRFTDSDGTTELNFWIESDYNVWVKIPSIPANSVKTIYLYYGNPSASTTSSGNKLFDFFDDFSSNSLDTSKWQNKNSNAPSFSNGEMTVSAGATDPSKVIAISASQNNNYTLRARFKIIGGVSVDERMGLSIKTATDTGNGYCYVLRDFTDCDEMSFVEDHATWSVRAGCFTKNTWYVEDIFHDGTNITGRFNNAPWQKWARKGLSGYPALNIGARDGIGVWDWALCYQYQPIEPMANLGVEERPIIFKSFSFSPSRMNIGDTVFFNATFNNPTNEIIKVQLAAREADNFNDTTDYFYQEEVSLPPSADTTFPFTWTAVGGPHTIWLVVNDYPYASVKIKVNRDPVIGPVKDQSLWQDRDFLLQVNASDPDGDSLTWSIDDPLFNISAASNRSAMISCFPTNDDIGIHRANITVRDTMNQTDTKRINFTVNNVNDPPVMTKIPSLSATQYNELRYQARASDPDLKWGDVLTFTENTDLFEIDGRTGEFAFTPVEEQVGKHNVKITVTDIAGASDTVSFTITVANVNDPPTLEILPPQFALQGRLFQLKIVAADPDLKSDTTEKLRFSDDSSLFNINNDTGLVSFTPTNDQIGVWLTNITVTDRGGLSSTTPLTINVMNANDPPSLEAIPAQTATEGVPFQYQTSASDPDLKWGLDNLTFTDDTDLFNIDPKTGAISFTPTGAQVGIKRVTITVKDEKGASASASFDLTVVHVNHPPTDASIKYPLDGAKLKQGDAMWLDGTAKDSDKGDTLEFNWLDNGDPVGTGRNISVKLSPGMHTITLEVSDGSETVSTQISVDVEKKETVTVASGSNDWIPLAAAVAAVFAIVAVAAVIAAKRRKKQEEPEPSDEGRVSSVPEEETVALPPVPPAEAGPKGSGEKAQKIIDSTVERLADYQEAHPEEALDVAPVMENLDIARDFLKSGEYDDALDFAKEAEAEVDKMTAPKGPKRVAVKKKKAPTAK